MLVFLGVFALVNVAGLDTLLDSTARPGVRASWQMPTLQSIDFRCG